jgi:Holliday junction resolvase RusA-like endonuclease
MRIDIKPLSVNKVWQGRRFKTVCYKEYEEELLYRLPELEIPEGKLDITLIWGFSSKASDIDNPTKPFLDVLQKKYDFDDKRIYRLALEKEDVKKGEDFIDFSIKAWDT